MLAMRRTGLQRRLGDGGNECGEELGLAPGGVARIDQGWADRFWGC